MSEAILMLLADARLPAAGHTQSGGLEPALRHDLAVEDIPVYLRSRLASVVRVEAATAVVARHNSVARLPLAAVEHAWEARTPSAAMRATSRQLGRGMLRLAESLWPGHEALRAAAEVGRPSRGVVLGAVAAVADLSPASVARLVGYDDIQTVAAAALKLEPLDPAVTTKWVLDALSLVDEMAACVESLTRTDAIPAAGSPQIEVWAEAHAHTSRRLFSA